MYVLYGLVLHGAEVGTGVLQQRAKDEGETDSQVNVDGLDEAVGVGQGGAGAHHQRGHGQDSRHSWSKGHTCTIIFTSVIHLLVIRSFLLHPLPLRVPLLYLFLSNSVVLSLDLW